MCAFITEILKDKLEDKDILAVYACSFMDSQTTSVTSILCALTGQIAQSSPASMEKFKRFLEVHGSEGELRPNILDLQDLIVEMSLSTDIRQIFIVIDGLDEGEWKQSDHLMAIVDIPQRARKVQMLVTSRWVHLIEKALHGYSTLSMNSVNLDATIAAFLERELMHREFEKIPQQHLQEIKENIIRRSNGKYVSSLTNACHV